MRSNLQTIKSTLLNGVHFWLEGLSAIFSFLDGSHGKESACNAGDLGSMPGLGRSLGEGNDYPIQYSFFFFSNPVFLPGEFHGQRSLAGYSLWGLKELDMTEQLTLSFSCFKVYNPVVFHIFAKFCCSIKVGHKKTAMS